MRPNTLRVALVAGERSGDILAANFMQSFTEKMSQQGIDVEYEGVAGPMMEALGFNKFYDMEELAVMGLVEVLGRLPRLLKIRRDLIKYWKQNPPDIMMGIDAPDFNLTLEAKLKAHGIKTVHYVSPSIWAWRQKRVFKVKKAVDLVLALLPFEKAFYDKYQVPCKFVGHTLADQIPMYSDKHEAKQRLGLDDGRFIAILPGSRASEVGLLAEKFAQASAILHAKYDDLKFVAAAVNEQRKQDIYNAFAQHAKNVEITIVNGQSRDVMAASEAIMIASGTATLEAALIKRPMVVCYRFKALSYQIFKRLVKVKFFSLPNLICGKAVVPELLQDEVTADKIATLIESALNAPDNQQVNDFNKIHKLLKLNAGELAADAVSEILNDQAI
ncbi:lipid-A-disaccharide synthase [Catenovulum sediminis]|uniref:Lipid-A-disaccharide synthase n=1 Tax=Catenovulum sediminis TaxID=1740262 RepID=A0ABV1RJ87_9ALTE|nr:lipid-A-disaccharide synthase [Catenovulum sediminis]